MDKHLQAVKEIHERRHKEQMADPIYAEGYNAVNHWVKPYPPCPYTFDKELDLARMRIAIIERPLTEAEKQELIRLNELFYKTKWERWTKGNYYRWCVEA